MTKKTRKPEILKTTPRTYKMPQYFIDKMDEYVEGEIEVHEAKTGKKGLKPSHAKEIVKCVSKIHKWKAPKVTNEG